MFIKQISVVLDPSEDHFSELTSIIESLEVNILTISTLSLKNQNLVALIVDNPEKTLVDLKERGFELSATEVLAVEVPHYPGGLNSILSPLKEAAISVKSLYPTVVRVTNNAVVILDTSDNVKSEKILKDNWIKLYTFEELRV